MPLYAYQALDQRGKNKKGLIKAENYSHAKELLKKNSLYLSRLVESDKHQINYALSGSMKIAFTRDLNQLLGAGLPLYESLLAIEEKYHNHPSHLLFAQMCEMIKTGKKLSEVMACYPKAFDSIYVSMIAASEETGSLEEAVKELEKLISKSQKLRRQLVSAMIYPAFLFGFCMVVVVGLLFFLIPSMEQLFEGRELHPMTQGVLTLSHFFRQQGMWIVSFFLISLCGSALFFKTKRGLIVFKRGLIKIPLIGKMITEGILIRFSRSLSVMLKGSVPLIEALALSKTTMNHPSFEEIITLCEKRILHGGKLSEELAVWPIIPHLVVRMVAIAEEAGTMSEMFYNIADIYEQDLERSLTRLTAMLQPVILLFLALVVGVVILSILLPLTDVGSFLNV